MAKALLLQAKKIIVANQEGICSMARMSCLNAVQALNALELQIVEDAPSEAKHIALIGAGDGRLADALAEKASAAKLTLAEGSASLRGYLGNYEDVSAAPFDLAWLETQVEAKGTIDYLIFYNIHDYWRGDLADFLGMTHLLSDSGQAWVSFLNSHARNILPYTLPQGTASFAGLAQPTRVSSSMDYPSWIALTQAAGLACDKVWGALDPEAYAYCGAIAEKKEKPKDIDIAVQGLKMHIKNVQDAYLWGGVFLAMRLKGGFDPKAVKAPIFTATEFNPLLYQSLLVPYPDNAMSQVESFIAATQAKQWKAKPEEELNPISKFFIDAASEMGAFKKVLLVGAGWGKELHILKTLKPDWEVTGLESDKRKIALKQDTLGDAAIELQSFDPEQPLPFDDDSFDLALTSNYLCHCHAPLVEHLVKELSRVSTKAIAHVEDSRGPSHNLMLKNLSLAEAYRKLGLEDKLSISPMLFNEKQSGLLLAKVPLD